MNKTAIVTGASHNIGQGIAIVLAEHGYDLAITYRGNEEGARDTEKAVRALGRKCFVYRSALNEAQAPQQLMDQAHRDLGRIDLLVCNAANPGFRCSVLTVTPEMVDEIYASNYRNYITCAGAAARYMVADRTEGSIVFITSTRAERAYPDDYLYGSLKAAIRRAAESMALDLSSYNIRVNCVAPGAIWQIRPGMEERLQSPFVTESIPLHRVGSAREVGEAVAYVAGDKASYMTGSTLRLDGGLILPGLMEGYEKIPWVRKEWKQNVYDEAMAMLRSDQKEPAIRNSRLKVTFRHPATEKYYHRFETIGVMAEVVLDGRDVFCEPEQLGSARFSCQGVGLCGEYVWDELGAEALKGERYPKFGVGLIEQNEDHKPYDMWDSSYKFTLFPVTARFLGDRAVFTQEPVFCRGYAARIVKEISLSDDCVISTVTLTNCGEKPIAMAEYQHNFVSINHGRIGPDLVLEVPFNKELGRTEAGVSFMRTGEKAPHALTVSDGTMHWNRSMGEGLTLFCSFEKECLDCARGAYWTLRDQKQGLSVTERFYFAPSRLVQWGIEHCVCTEVYAPIEAAPGESCRWTRTWQFKREKGE